MVAGLFAAVGLATSSSANLPTLLYRWHHATNLLGVPDRVSASAEAYPLRLVELLSPVTATGSVRSPALADHLYEPGREGLGTAQLGLAAAIGFVCAVAAVLVRAVRGAERRGWSFESRLGIVIVAALLLGMKGGVSRALELTGLMCARGPGSRSSSRSRASWCSHGSSIGCGDAWRRRHWRRSPARVVLIDPR